jgi:hypothetical protein
MNELLVAGPVLAGGYGLLIGAVALIASMHPDEKRRADAHKVLDKLMRFGRSRR